MCTYGKTIYVAGQSWCQQAMEDFETTVDFEEAHPRAYSWSSPNVDIFSKPGPSGVCPDFD